MFRPVLPFSENCSLVKSLIHIAYKLLTVSTLYFFPFSHHVQTNWFHISKFCHFNYFMSSFQFWPIKTYPTVTVILSADIGNQRRKFRSVFKWSLLMVVIIFTTSFNNKHIFNLHPPPQNISIYFLWFSQQTANVSQNSINLLISVVKTWYVSCEVQTAYLRIIEIKFEV
jgi:hypothetical protein